jgi:peptidoglycan/xylan/chitin deacetylase (PgdA/CDA1 family)
LKKQIKNLLGYLMYRSGLHRLVWRNRALVVVFHRVDDAYPGDPLTCTRAEFERYCDFFARFWKVVSLSELLDRLRDGRDIGRHLVITFDDGYKDNHAYAARELRRRSMPATFYVSTGFIESTHVPWWDAERNIVPEWMTWEEVRSLHADGFEVAPHTVTHVDLGVVEGQEARREIGESKTRLEQELGIPMRSFAYPYGRRHQLSEPNREIMRELGFECCASAFGGYVTPDMDPMRLQRTAIGPWYDSPWEFGFLAMRRVDP